MSMDNREASVTVPMIMFGELVKLVGPELISNSISAARKLIESGQDGAYQNHPEEHWALAVSQDSISLRYFELGFKIPLSDALVILQQYEGNTEAA